MNTRTDDAPVPPEAHAAQPPSAPPVDVARSPRARRLRKIGAWAVLGGVVLAMGFWFVRHREPDDDLARWQGEWLLAVPAGDDGDPASARRKPVLIRIHGDRWIYVANGHEQRRYAITLRPDTHPKEIDLVQLTANDQPLMQQWPPPPQPVTLRGIYLLERNRATVATSIGREPRPTAFEASDGVTLWLLERQP